MAQRKKYHIKRDDKVMVIAGKEKGKTGKVHKVFPKKDRAVVEKVNFIKRHTRPGPHSRQGGIIEKESPIHLSNIALYNPETKKADRVGVKILEDGRKVRFYKSNGEVVDLG